MAAVPGVSGAGVGVVVVEVAAVVAAVLAGVPVPVVVGFAALGAGAVALARVRRRDGALARAAGLAGSAVAAFAVVVLFGSTGRSPAFAVPLLLVAFGYVLAAWVADGGTADVRWLPVPAAVAALTAMLVLWRLLLGRVSGGLVRVDRAASVVLAIGLVTSGLLAAVAALGQAALARRRAATAHDAMLRAAYSAVSSASELADGFASFAVVVLRRVPFERASLAVLDDANATLVAVAGKGAALAPVGTALPMKDPLLAAVAEANGPYVVADTEAELPESKVISLGIRSFVTAPVVVAGASRALLTFSSTRPGAFSAADGEIVGELTNAVGGALYTLVRLETESETAARLWELDQLKNEFVGIVAHDLRSPMTVIAGYVDTVLTRWDALPDETKRELLGVASRNTKRLSTMVEDVLHVARIESGDFPYNIRPIDLGALVTRTVAEMNAARADRPVLADVPPDLPMALGDEDRQWRVLTNLVSNAQKFSPPETPVRVKVRLAEGAIEVSVTDRGPGIPPESMPRLFGKFSRLAAAPGGEKGTGLGLYICKALVEAQGGTIDVDSEVGVGTTMRYTVPLPPP